MKMMHTQKKIRAAVLGLLMMTIGFAAYAETVSVSTYYPSPYGAYQTLTATTLTTATLTATGNSYLATTGGNVGIGNAGPGAKLDVTGNILMSGARSVLLTTGDNAVTHRGGVQFLTPDNGVTSIWTPTNQVGTPVDSTVTLGGFGSFNNNTVNLGVSGSVGIGTAAPTSKLTVKGGQISLDNGGATIGVLQVDCNSSPGKCYAAYA